MVEIYYECVNNMLGSMDMTSFIVHFSLHSRKLAVKRLGSAASCKTVSNLRSFKKVAEDKLMDLTKTKLKKRTKAKMMWGVRAYNEWHSVRLSDADTFDIQILRSDLNDCNSLNKADLEYSLCRFVVEVVKVKDGSDYPGRTLYQLCIAIQKYLFSEGLKWKLVEGDFESVMQCVRQHYERACCKMYWYNCMKSRVFII